MLVKVTRKEIFDFHNNLITIIEDEPNSEEECDERERRYIEYWLKSKGVKIES